ncbi:MAG: HAD family hydrolase [Nitrospina sp.]|jgi:5-amino-6-(5-phospho-D-ribitylamino)uracil phosphatase|nr:HAD family hydrolase [Nitrospina sp.]MBT3508807.1 HAD family hydrolase [Nitrospina sp.]MBT3874561.1 HAD family hydrolase [Nitrospina sp.]MBT4047035.1 HAD family hydrolase [Nitrospina sp.]MBT4557943.1 HAD family hydrolase [Nitrospina sp.]
MNKDLLYISDMDGTLLLPDGTFPDDYKKRLNRLIDMGLRFTIATARNYDSAHPILNGLNLKLPVVLFNGVYLADFNSGHVLEYANSIDRQVVENMLKFALPRGIDPFIYTFGEEHKLYYQNATNPGSQAYVKSLEGDGRLCKVDRFQFQEDEKISGFLLIDTHDQLKPVYQSLQENHFDHLNLYFAEDVSMKGYHWLQSFHQEASKGNMIEILSQKLEIPLERIVVFGDYLNDLDMFRIAGRAIAVENALQEVKDSAHEIIGSNSQGAVLQYLELIFLDK